MIMVMHSVLVLSFSLLPAVAMAEPAPQKLDRKAAAHLLRGLEHYRNQEYNAAADEFQLGYAIDPSPDFLFAMAQARRRQGDCAAAVQSYRAFLKTGPSARQAAIAVRNVERCVQKPVAPPLLSEIARVTEAAPIPALTEPKIEAATFRPGIQPEPPPAPKVEIPPPALLQPKEVTPASSRPPPPAAPPPPWHRDPLGLGLAGGAVVALAVGITLAAVGGHRIAAIGSANNYDMFAQRVGNFVGDLGMEYAGIGLCAVAAALAAGSAFRFVLARRNATVAVAVTGDGARVSLRADF